MKIFDGSISMAYMKEGYPIYIKEGYPQRGHLKKLSEIQIISRDSIIEMMNEIKFLIGKNEGVSVELDQEGIFLVEIKSIRVLIVYPPYSSEYEITAVKQSSLDLSIYNMNFDLLNKLEFPDGVLICGRPASGKTTISNALITFYLNHNLLVKSIGFGSLTVGRLPLLNTYKKLTHTTDVLLLSRPEIVIFDEIRSGSDIRNYIELRLSGIGTVGTIGTIHASSCINAVLRFLPHVDMGIFANIIDTIIFLKNGAISDVMTLKMDVRVPTNLCNYSNDLSRPIVVITDFFTQKIKYELYSYGQSIILSPIGKTSNYEENYGDEDYGEEDYEEEDYEGEDYEGEDYEEGEDSKTVKKKIEDEKK